MKYHNEMKLEMLNTPENEEFAKKATVNFIEPLNPTPEGIEEVKEMVSDVIASVNVEYGSEAHKIILKVQVDGRNIVVEAKKKEVDL